jgi:hypothetical protein
VTPVRYILSTSGSTNGNLSRSVNGGSDVVIARGITIIRVVASGSTADVDVTATAGTTPTSTVRILTKVMLRNYSLR